jgi:DNA-binding PadR family transcriptional regulator
VTITFGFSSVHDELALDVKASNTQYDTRYDRYQEPSMSVPHALLALLRDGPKYGLRLQNEFEARTGEVWPLNVGQVYTTLQRLERDGLVETDEGEAERSQKRYRITAAGSRELADWLRTPPDLVPPPRDELVIKVLVGLQVPGIDVHELLQVHRRHVIEVMQRYTRIKAAAAKDDVPLALVADAELFRLEAIVRWLDATDVRLKQLADRPAAAPDLALEPTRPMEVSQ